MDFLLGNPFSSPVGQRIGETRAAPCRPARVSPPQPLASPPTLGLKPARPPQDPSFHREAVAPAPPALPAYGRGARL